MKEILQYCRPSEEYTPNDSPFLANWGQSPGERSKRRAEPPEKSIPNNNRFFPYRQVILDLAKNHNLKVIDLWQAFINDPTPLAGLLADALHPNDKGYEIFAKEVTRAISDMLYEEMSRTP